MIQIHLERETMRETFSKTKLVQLQPSDEHNLELEANVAENAGDMISEVNVAMTNGLGLSKIGATIHPYPTQAEAIRKLGDQFNKTKLTSFSEKILGILMKLNVGG